MKLALVNLTAGNLSGGYLKYVQRLVPLLLDDPRVERLYVFMPPGVQLPHLSGVGLCSWSAADAWSGFRALGKELRRLAPDAVFIPTARWLDCGSIPVTVMVRNMEPLLVPFAGNPLKERLKNIARRYTAKQACQRADRVIAVSAHVRDFLTQTWRIPSSKIGVVYHGVEPAPSRSCIRKPETPGGFDGGDFLFTAGSIRPARGLEDLIKALPSVIERDPALKCVIAGKPDAAMRRYQQRLVDLAQSLNVAAGIIWAGQLASAEMSWYYTHCRAFVMTSRAEACPNIALEAMSHGAFCISTNNPPMPEFFQRAAFYYEAQQAESLANILLTVLDAPAEQLAAYRKAAASRAAAFVWSQTAQQTIQELLVGSGE